MGNGYGVSSNLASSDEPPPLLHMTTLTIGNAKTRAMLARCGLRADDFSGGDTAAANHTLTARRD